MFSIVLRPQPIRADGESIKTSEQHEAERHNRTKPMGRSLEFVGLHAL